MRKNTAILCLCLAGLLLTVCNQGDKKVSLRYKFTPGLKLYYLESAKTNERIIENGTITGSTGYTVDYDITIECVGIVDDTVLEVSQLARADSATFVTPDSTWTMAVNFARTTTGRTLTNGKLLNINLDDAVPEHRRAYMQAWNQQGTAVFPSGERPVGYSWTQTTTVVLPDETMETSTTYTITALVRESGYDCAVVEYEGLLILPVQPKEDDPEQRRGSDRVEGSGKIYFAYEPGFVVRQTEKRRIQGDRKRNVDGDTVSYRVEQDYSVVFQLQRKEGGS
ncbi:MAG: hypothetical protein JSV52_04665 [Candidatus Zixiibacteriota bacterium]|nr:MAG: hypothetical protein JSV52_04665 [candidate division Zixibacteria bacterium]